MFHQPPVLHPSEINRHRQQRSELHCPWQNGRIERLFGTLKQKLDQWEVASFNALNLSLAEFRFFYDVVRPHQNLEGRRPAEAWAGMNPFAAKFKGEYWFAAWGGLLQGYYLRRCGRTDTLLKLMAKQVVRGGARPSSW